MQQAPPALPLAPEEYTPAYQNGLIRILRLYFSTLFNFSNALVSSVGAGYLKTPSGQFSSIVSQTAAGADTPTRVAFEVTDYANEIYAVAGDGVHVNHPGVYNYQFSIQLENPTAQYVEVTIWLKQNGVDVPYTASKYAISIKHGAINGYLIVTCNFFISMAAGDYVELWWATTDALVIMEAYPAQTVPYACPGIPSAVATLSFVSCLME